MTLARHGVPFLLVDRKPRLSDLPRATGVSTRSMELFRSWGIEADVRAGEVEVAPTLWACRTLTTAEDGVPVFGGWPTPDQAAVVSPTRPGLVPQDHVERVMLDDVLARGGRVEMGAEVVSLEQTGDGVEAVIRSVASGAEQRVRARYVIGADGTRSAVRAALGIQAPARDGLAAVVTAQFHAPLWALLGEHRHVLYRVTDPVGEGIFVPSGGDRWVYAVDWDPSREALEDFPAERLVPLISAGVGDPSFAPRIERIGGFSYTAALADRFREGDVFLAGDAAHRVTPRGGTGMNMAIHDGFDLGWKLAWVANGWAGPELLDSYEGDRRPVAERNVEWSARADGSERDVTEELHIDLGGRIPHVWLPRGGERVSTLDLLGPGFTLFAGPDAPGWHRAAAELHDAAGTPPVTKRTVGGLAARALAVRPRGALLVRPDGMPVASWSHEEDAPESLRSAYGGDPAAVGRALAQAA
jgi:2-polyprenyl-6-methoxyphenol hydroxylase-like FAD-dependent oxidoreductase